MMNTSRFLLVLPAATLLLSACAPEPGPRHVVYGPTSGGYYGGPGYYGNEGHYRREYDDQDHHRYDDRHINQTDVTVNRTNVNERTVNRTVVNSNVNRTNANVNKANAKVVTAKNAHHRDHKKDDTAQPQHP